MAYNKSLEINDNTYAGEQLAGFVNAAVLQAESIERGLVTVVSGVMGGGLTMKIGSDLASPLAAYTCDFAAAQATNLNERKLNLTKLKVDRDYCKDDFFGTWLAFQTGTRANMDLPTEFQSWLEGYLVSLIAGQNERTIWQGNFTPGGLAAIETAYTGLLERIDAANVNVSNTQTAAAGNAAISAFVTPADVNHNMQVALNTLPTSLRGKYATVRFIVSAYTYELYFRHLANVGLAQMFQAADRPVTFLGYVVEIAPGMAENCILLGESSNLFVGTTSEADLTEAIFLDMKDKDASDNVRVRFSLAIGTQVAIPSDVVLVRPSIT
jgi:hypothetical protein